MTRDDDKKPTLSQVRAVLGGTPGGECASCGGRGPFRNAECAHVLVLPFPETLVKPEEVAAVQVLPTYSVKLMGLWLRVDDPSTYQPSVSGAHAVQVQAMVNDSTYMDGNGTRVCRERPLLKSALPLPAAMFPYGAPGSGNPKAISPSVLMELLESDGWLPVGSSILMHVRNSGTEPWLLRASAPGLARPY